MVSLWEALRESGISTSRLHNFEQLLEQKQHGWRTGDPASDEAALIGLGEAMIRHYFKGPVAETVRAALHEGFLLKTLKMYLHILKSKLEKSYDG